MDMTEEQKKYLTNLRDYCELRYKKALEEHKSAIPSYDMDWSTEAGILTRLLADREDEYIPTLSADLKCIFNYQFLQNGGWAHGVSDLVGIGFELMESDKGEKIESQYEIKDYDDLEKYDDLDIFSEERTWDDNGTEFCVREDIDDIIDIYEIGWYNQYDYEDPNYLDNYDTVCTVRRCEKI